jgi:hypothetical protein
MFIRQQFRTRNGQRHAYWALVESYRTATEPRQRIVAWLGKLDEASRLGVKHAAEAFYHHGHGPGHATTKRSVRLDIEFCSDTGIASTGPLDRRVWTKEYRARHRYRGFRCQNSDNVSGESSWSSGSLSMKSAPIVRTTSGRTLKGISEGLRTVRSSSAE